MRSRYLPALAAALLVAAACGGDDAGGAEPAGDWPVGEPQDHGMDSAVLDQARDYAFQDAYQTQGVVIIRDGTIVAEWYADGVNETTWATSYSMAKSVTSALIGIAIDEGLIPSVDEPMTTYYPEWAGSPREDITMRHVLQMSSGLDFTEDPEVTDCITEALDGEREIESCRPELGDLDLMLFLEPDQVAFAASRPLANEPGSRFSYSSGDTMLLSGVLEQVTGSSVAEYAAERLFEPLGMSQVDWWSDASGSTTTYAFLDSTTRDFARLGQLYLNGGSWNGEQIVPAEWVADSLDRDLSWEWYGYQWWLDPALNDQRVPEDAFAAEGFGGQSMTVIPSLDLVVVRNALHVKPDGDAVGDPNMAVTLAPNREALGAFEKSGWNVSDLLLPILESIDGFEVDVATCPHPWGGSCLGDLAAGTYTTAEFQPRLSYAVPDGWENSVDRPSAFMLALDAEVEGGIYVGVNPLALIPDPQDEANAPEPDPTVGRSYAELVDWLTAHPLLTITDPAPVSVGGLDGVMVDARIADGAVSQPFYCDVDACVDIFGTEMDDSDIWGDVLYSTDDQLRWLLLETGDGGAIVILIDEWENTDEDFATLVELAQPIVDSFEFTD